MLPMLVAAMALFAAAPAAAGPDAKNQKPAEKQYCISYQDDTGSHVARTECHTESDWRRLGVDVDEMSKHGSDSGGLA